MLKKNKLPKVPRVKNKKGRFISRKEKEAHLIAEAATPRFPTFEEMEKEPLIPAEEGPFEVDSKGNTVESYEGNIPAEVPEVLEEIQEMEKATELQKSPPLTEEKIEVPIIPPSREAREVQTPKIVPIRPDSSTYTNLPLPETKDSSPEQPEPPPENTIDPQYTRLADHVLTTVTEPYIQAHMHALVANPQVIPRLGLWTPKVPLNIPKIVLAIITQPGYIQQQYPVLKVLMGNSFDNIAWTTNVLITLAFYDCVKVLPFAEHLPGAKQ